MAILTYKCWTCGTYLGAQHTTKNKWDWELEVEPALCPICSGDRTLWDEWAKPV